MTAAPPSPSIPARALIALVRAYQRILGPILGGHCRFSPTCSNYAVDALARHGALRGSVLAVKRTVRCHPWWGGGAGHDPVP